MIIELINHHINQMVDLMFHQYVTNNFYIGLEDIKRYVRFYFWVTHLQSLEPTYSVTKVNEMIIKDEGLEDYFYQNGGKNSNLDKFIERGIDQYHGINFRTIKEEKLRSEKLKNTNVNGNCYMNRKIDLKESQIHQYKTHRQIKDQGDYLKNNKDSKLTAYRTTTGRINRELKNINLKNLKELYEHYKLKIEDSDVISKSLECYQLEKSLQYNLLISILLHVSKYCNSEEEALQSISDLRLLFLNPLVDQRQKYVPLYFTLDEAKKERWVQEILGLNKFIDISILGVFQDEIIDGLLGLVKNQLNYEIITGYYELDDFTVHYKKKECNLDYYRLILNQIMDLNHTIDELNTSSKN